MRKQAVVAFPISFMKVSLLATRIFKWFPIQRKSDNRTFGAKIAAFKVFREHSSRSSISQAEDALGKVEQDQCIVVSIAGYHTTLKEAFMYTNARECGHTFSWTKDAGQAME